MSKGLILYQQINIFKLHSIEGLCKDLDIRLLPIRPEDRNTPLGVLAGISAAPPSPKAVFAAADAREMLVLCGLTPDLLDRFLNEYHKREIPPVELKAVLTAYNANWTPNKLQTELIKESRLS